MDLLATLRSPGRTWDGLLIRDLSRLSCAHSDLAGTVDLLRQHSCDLFTADFSVKHSALPFSLLWYSLLPRVDAIEEHANGIEPNLAQASHHEE